MGEAMLYNIKTKPNIKYDWNTAFNNSEFVNNFFFPLMDYIDNSRIFIPDYEFKDITSYQTATFNSCWQDIGVEAFANMKNLKTISFYSYYSSSGFSLYSIKSLAFKNCQKLSQVVMYMPHYMASNMFEGCDNLETFINDGLYGMTICQELSSILDYPTIPSHTFANLSKLSSVCIPYLYEIGEYAFENCIKLSSVNIGGSCVINIGSHAFKNCYSLSTYRTNDNGGYWTSSTAYSIWNLNPTIGEYAFEGCSILSTVRLSAVGKICQYAFANCSSLTYIDLGSYYSSSYGRYFSCSLCIEPYAFYNCSSLSTVYNGSIVNYIGSHAFENCINLKSIGNGLAYNIISKISDYAFKGCISLYTININTNIYGGGNAGDPSNPFILDIASTAFEGCSNLLTIHITNGPDIYSGWFSNLSNLAVFCWEYDFTGSGYYKYYLKVNVGDYALANCHNLSYISIPFIKSIGKYAFMSTSISYFYTDLTDYVDEYAFSDCNMLSNIELNKSAYSGIMTGTMSLSDTKLSFHSNAFKNVTLNLNRILLYNCDDIPSGAFSNISYLATFIMSAPYQSFNPYEIITNIGDEAFFNCSVLSNVIILNVDNIGEYAFYGCSNMEYCNIGYSVCKTVKPNAFNMCSRLKYIYLNMMGQAVSAMCNIESNAFAGCFSLSAIYMSNIGRIENAFGGCPLETISIYGYPPMPQKQSLNYIGSYTFAGKTTLSSVILNLMDTIYDQAFTGCTNLTSIICGAPFSGIIGSSAFDGCYRLSSIGNMLISVSYIGEAAFRSCDLRDFVLTSIQHIGSEAFANCSQLSSITIYMSSVPTLVSIDAFESIYSDYVINVPSTMYSYYINDSIWGLISSHIVQQT